MKRILAGRLPRALAAALAGGMVLASCASNDPIRQQNLADLERLEACGWYPKAFDPFYPADLQKAEERSRNGDCGPGRNNPALNNP